MTKGCPTPPRPTEPRKLPVLYSYAYIRKWREERLVELLSNERIEVLIDSGAFTAKNAGEEISLDEYVRWLHKWKSRLFGYIALDVLQDPAGTDRNLEVMLKEGLSPVPVHVYGDSRERMDELFSRSRWVALGGFRRPHRRCAPDDYIKAKMTWAAGRDVHWLGYGLMDRVTAYTPFSCDTASWARGVIYGLVDIYLGNGTYQSVRIDTWARKKQFLRGDLLERLRRYDIDPEHMLQAKYWKRGPQRGQVSLRDSIVLKLPVRSWIDYVLDVRERLGTRLFMAIGSTEEHTAEVLSGLDYILKVRGDA